MRAATGRPYGSPHPGRAAGADSISARKSTESEVEAIYLWLFYIRYDML